MAPQVFPVSYATLGTRRVSPETMSVTLESTRAQLEAGHLETRLTPKLLGLLEVSVNWDLYWSGELAAALLADFHAQAAQASILTLGTGAVGARCLLWRAGWSGLPPLGSGARAEVSKLALTQGALADDPIYVGNVLQNTYRPAVGQVTANGSTAAVQVGAIPAGSVGFLVLAVGANPSGISGTTPTLDVVLESDNDEAFPSAVTRHTFAQVTTTPTTFVVRFDGDSSAITDDWWRLTFTVGGTSPSYHVLGGLAVASKIA